ncbi:Protein of unknown function [Pyronema omphalodes CBS 100304]|uniref:Uncharacterized protein n=1 Tax=Pyronema omphalodes (strain CBS 100304) TaxID=1076935 RepID=U4LQB8_PYROM|nr:Protein of unknown function [Pyronema omphalodes CBS 100304]
MYAHLCFHSIFPCVLLAEKDIGNYGALSKRDVRRGNVVRSMSMRASGCMACRIHKGRMYISIGPLLELAI